MVGVTRIVARVSAKAAATRTRASSRGTRPAVPAPQPALQAVAFPDGVHVIEALAPYEDLVGARHRHDRGPPGGRGDPAPRSARPERQRGDRPAAHPALPADPGGPPRARAGGRRRAAGARLHRAAGSRADGRRRAHPDGRLQRMGRRVRPVPARRPRGPLPLADGRAAVVDRGSRDGDALRPVQPGRDLGPALLRDLVAAATAGRTSSGSSWTSATTTAARSATSRRSWTPSTRLTWTGRAVCT